MKNQSYWVLVILIVTILNTQPSLVWALSGNTSTIDCIPKSPEAAAFDRITDIPVSMYTGTMNFSIPLYTITSGDISLPISLDCHYYPLGLTFYEGSTPNYSFQPYKYAGKELDLVHGLNTYDYGARQYNPVTGQWDRMDPFCEKYYHLGPYSYCVANPVNMFDPDGRNPWKVLAKGTFKIWKTVAKQGLSALNKSATYASAFNGVIEDTKTVFDSNASTTDRVFAVVSLASEIASPVSVKDAKDIKDATKELHHYINPKKLARQQTNEIRDKQPASERYAKNKAKELEKKEGKDARRKAHDAKERGEPDRSKKQIDEDYKRRSNND